VLGAVGSGARADSAGLGPGGGRLATVGVGDFRIPGESSPRRGAGGDSGGGGGGAEERKKSSLYKHAWEPGGYPAQRRPSKPDGAGGDAAGAGAEGYLSRIPRPTNVAAYKAGGDVLRGAGGR